MVIKYKRQKLLPILLGYFISGFIIVGIVFKLLFKKISFKHQGVEYGKNSNR